MRKLKIVLADGNAYTFSTLTIKEQSVARKLEKLSADEQKELDELIRKSGTDEGLVPEEESRLDAYQSKQIRSMLKILLMSVAKTHEEFRVKQEDIDKAYDKLEGLIDLRDMRRLTSFALMGSLPREDEAVSYEYEEVIDLTFSDKK